MTPQKNEVRSPCIRNCALNLEDICMGCYRSLEEIVAWHKANNEERLIILQRAQQRKAQAEPQA